MRVSEKLELLYGGRYPVGVTLTLTTKFTPRVTREQEGDGPPKRAVEMWIDF